MIRSPLTYYYDEAHNNRVPVNESGHPILDWGETIPGKRKELTLFVQNESKDQLVIRQPFSTDTTLKIEDYPSRLFSEEQGTIKFSLTPDINKIESHHGSWGYEIVIG
jgi:hypothetical protein